MYGSSLTRCAGVDGRQIVAIRTGDEDDAPQFEVKAEDLERVQAA
jgi:hypothetical protein